MHKPILCLLAALVAAQSCAQAGEAKLALNGSDPIEFINGKTVQGREDLNAANGRFKYLFSTAENRSTFLKDPDRYGIQLDGKCVMSDSMDGSMRLAQVVKGRIYLSGSDMCQSAFRDRPDAFVNVDTGARLVMQNQGAQQADTRPVAGILVFPGVQIIDYAGPYEVLGQGGMRVVLIAATKDPFTTAMGMNVIPHHTFKDAPKLDVLLLPGGNVQADESPETIAWIKEKAAEAKFTMSVCNGAFWLAKAGLLDGKTATTFYGLIDSLAEAAPKAKIVTNQRYTDNGNIITTAGLSSGIDGSLYLISKMRGHGAAQAVALNMEYDWNPKSTYARASFADKPLRLAVGAGFPFAQGAVTGWTVEEQRGDDKTWQKSWTFGSSLGLNEVAKVVGDKLGQSWQKSGERNGGDEAVSDWAFDAEGSKWTAKATTTKVGEGKFRLVIHLNRA